MIRHLIDCLGAATDFGCMQLPLSKGLQKAFTQRKQNRLQAVDALCLLQSKGLQQTKAHGNRYCNSCTWGSKNTDIKVDSDVNDYPEP